MAVGGSCLMMTGQITCDKKGSVSRANDSEKQETTAKAGGEERGRATSAVGTAMVVMGS
jgi:hypothetical protein